MHFCGWIGRILLLAFEEVNWRCTFCEWHVIGYYKNTREKPRGRWFYEQKDTGQGLLRGPVGKMKAPGNGSWPRTISWYFRSLAMMDTFHRTWQDIEPLSFITWNLNISSPLPACGFCSGQLIYHQTIEIPYPALFQLRFPHPNSIITRNPAPARNCNSRFSPLLST